MTESTKRNSRKCPNCDNYPKLMMYCSAKCEREGLEKEIFLNEH